MKHAPVCALVVAMALLVGINADCPDRDVRCRIANFETRSEVTTTGCEAGATADVGFAGSVPTGTVGVNGKCYRSYQESDGTNFVPMGVFRAGSCYQYAVTFGDMSVDQSCRPCSPLAEQCSEKVEGCKACSRVCTFSHTVVSGDTCWDIANDHALTVDQLVSMNPGLACEPLQVNTNICLATGEGQCTHLCEGRYV